MGYCPALGNNRSSDVRYASACRHDTLKVFFGSQRQAEETFQKSATSTTQRDTSHSPLALARGFEGPRWLNRFNGLLLCTLPRLIAVEPGVPIMETIISRAERETVENDLG